MMSRFMISMDYNHVLSTTFICSSTSMDPSIWSKGMYSSSNIFHDRCTAEYLSSLHTDFPPSNSDLLAASVSSHEDNEHVNLLPERVYCNSSNAGSSSVCCRHPELSLSGKSHLSRRRDPSSNRSHEWNMNSGHQAKRARVENIIKGMTCSNIVQYTNVMTNEQQPDNVQGNRSFQQLPLHHEGHGAGNNSSATSQTDACECLYKFENRKNQGWKKLKLMKYTQFKPERTKLMADVLKYELSRAVTKSIDSIFKSMPQLQTSTNKASYHSPLCKDNKFNLPRDENAKLRDEDVQTEALSLVVPKPRVETSDMFRCGSRDHHLHGVKPPISDSFSSIPHEEELSQTNANQRALTSSDAEQAMFDVFGSHPVKVRSKVNSRSVTSLTVDPTSPQSLRLPHVKMESDGPAKNNLYPTNVSLTPFYANVYNIQYFFRYSSFQSS